MIGLLIGIVIAAVVLAYLGLSQPTTAGRLQRRREELLLQQGAAVPQLRSAVSEELSA